MAGLPTPIRAGAVVLMFGLAAGCKLTNPSQYSKIRPSPTDVVDRDMPDDAPTPLNSQQLKQAAEQIRLSRKPEQLPKRTYNILVLSGGGIYGAYSAGVLSGWTETGQRPNFDVITGISTGGLIAAVAFLGPEYDWLLKDLYTTVQNRDIFQFRGPVKAIVSESIVNTSPMERRLRDVVTPELLAKTAAEHARGRRLYIGTTNLPTRRLVVWDMGAIASRATPESEKLFEDILLASSAVPGLFPPQRITVDVDGREYEELHVDGGVSRSMFFRPPYLSSEDCAKCGPTTFYGSTVYALVAGKLYSDPDAVRPRSLPIAGNAITSLLYSQIRGDVDRLYHFSTLTGMNFRLAALPLAFQSPSQSLKFDPVEMTRLFEEGRKQAISGTAWRDHPPALDRTEELRARTGTHLTQVAPNRETSPPPMLPEGRGLVPPLRMPVPPGSMQR